MAKADVTIVGGMAMSHALPFITDDRTTSSQTETIKPGEPVQMDNENFVEIIATGGPVQTDGLLVGIATTESTETSSAEGEVEAQVVVPFITIMRAKATTPGNVDTVAKFKLLRQDTVAFTNSSNVITVNEDEGDDPNVHGLIMIGCDTAKGLIDFFAKPLATLFGRSV
jgi:hypothetical protein